MYFQDPCCEININQLLQQIKVKNKQICFLQDKIFLIQRQRQSKINQIQHRYFIKNNKLAQLNQTLEQQNQMIKIKLQKSKIKINSLNQTIKSLNQEINSLNLVQKNNNKQSKTYKIKYQKQKKKFLFIQQQNNKMITLINTLHKQLNQLSKNNLKLIQEKNKLMSTLSLTKNNKNHSYSNSCQILQQKVQQIQKIYKQQYENQLNLIKEKMKNEIETNTIQLMKQFNCKVIVQNQQQDQVDSNNNKTIIKHNYYSQKHNFPQTDKSWQQDINTLKNYVQYGQQFILLSSVQQNLQLLNHSQSKNIYKYIQNLLSKNKQLLSEINLKNYQLNEIKTQSSQKMDEILKQLQSHLQKQNKKEYVNQISQTDEGAFQKQSLRVNKIEEQNYLMKQKLSQVKDIVKLLINIVVKLINKAQIIHNKIQLYHNQKQNNSKETDKKKILRQKFKKTILSVFFIQHLKKINTKLRRKANLTLDLKSNHKQGLPLMDVILYHQENFNLISSSSNSYFDGIFKKVLFQIKKQKLLCMNKNFFIGVNSSNLQIQKFFNVDINKINSLLFDSSKSTSSYQTIIKIIFQQKITTNNNRISFSKSY